MTDAGLEEKRKKPMVPSENPVAPRKEALGSAVEPRAFSCRINAAIASDVRPSRAVTTYGKNEPRHIWFRKVIRPAAGSAKNLHALRHQPSAG